MEPNQQTPSVIARLMGLDNILPQQPVTQKHRVLSDNYLRKIASIGMRQKRSTHEGQSFRMSIEDQQEFKDIYEVPETDETEKHCNQLALKGKTKSSLSNAKMPLLRQKFADEEFPLQNVRLQHLHDLQSFSSHPHQGNRTNFKSCNVPNITNTKMCRISENTTEQRIVTKSHQKLDKGPSRYDHGELGVYNSHKSPKFQSELKDGICHRPARIVILKPNFGRAQNSVRSSSPPGSYEGSPSCDRKHKEFSTLENEELFAGANERIKLDNNMEFSRHSFRLSREIAKEVTQQMKRSIRSCSTNVSRSEFSCVAASTDESELMMMPSQISFDWKNRYQSSFHYSNGTSAAKETKKRFSERWRITKKYQEVGLSSRCSTLGEILSMPDQEMRSINLDLKLTKHDVRNPYDCAKEDANLGRPLGICSQDGWKDDYVSDLSTSRSHSASSTTTRSPKNWPRHEALFCDWYLRPDGVVCRGQHKSRKQKIDQKDVLKPKNSRTSCTKSLSFPCADLETNHSSPETSVIPKEIMSESVEKDLLEQNSAVPKLSSQVGPCLDSSYPIVLETDETRNNFEKDLPEQNSMASKSSGSITETNLPMFVDTVADTKTEGTDMSIGVPEEWQSESANQRGLPPSVFDPSILQGTSCISPEKGTFPSNCLTIGSDSMSSEEAFQASPVSVLELPLKEEISSASECFESVSADADGLQMQLQLLKSVPSESYSDRPAMIVSSDEDTGEESLCPDEHGMLMRLAKAGESMDFSYLNDVLVEAGSHDDTWDIGFETWHSSECPLSPLVFKVLEKKYGEHTSWERSERRLLFDRINLGLLEILQPLMDMSKWAKPVRKRFPGAWWSREVIEEELWMLLVSQKKQQHKDTSGKLLGRDIRWLELGDEIDVIGREIEKFLIDELAAEFMSMEESCE